MAPLPNKPWTTSLPGSQDTDGVEQGDLTNDSAPGANDGHRVLVEHLHALRDKAKYNSETIGDANSLPAGSLKARVATLESTPATDINVRADGSDASPGNLTSKLDTPAVGITKTVADLGGSNRQVQLALNFGTGAGYPVEDTDSRLTDDRDPTAHAASHKSGGADAVKLDELDTPTDVTTLDATTGAHGLLPKLGGGTDDYLRADGTWVTPPTPTLDEVHAQGNEIEVAGSQGGLIVKDAAGWDGDELIKVDNSNGGAQYDDQAGIYAYILPNNASLLEGYNRVASIMANASGAQLGANKKVYAFRATVASSGGTDATSEQIAYVAIHSKAIPASPGTRVAFDAADDPYGSDGVWDAALRAASGSVWLEDGQIRLKEISADPSNVADYGFLYTKDVGGTTELFYQDSAGNVRQLTPIASGSPLTTKGDLYGYDTDDARLAVGTDGQVLVADSASAIGLKWDDAPSGSPLTTKGDLHSYDTDDARLPVGTDGQVLVADSAEATGLKWDDAPTESPLTTKGDLFGYSTVAARLPVGSDGQVLVVDAAEATGLKWDTPPSNLDGDFIALSDGQPASTITISGSDHQVIPESGAGLAFTALNTGRYAVRAGFQCAASSGAATAAFYLVFDEGESNEQTITPGDTWRARGAAGAYSNVLFEWEVSLTAGDHTVKLYGSAVTGTTFQIIGSGTTTNMAPFLILAAITGGIAATMETFSTPIASNIAVNVTATEVQIAPASGSYSFKAPNVGKYRVDLRFNGYYQYATAAGNFRWKVVFDDGLGSEVVLGDDDAWGNRIASNQTNDYVDLAFNGVVELEAKTYTVKAYGTRQTADGGSISMVSVGDGAPQISIQSISAGAGGGGELYVDTFTAAGGDEDFTISAAPAVNTNTPSGYDIVGVTVNGVGLAYDATPADAFEFGYTPGTTEIVTKSLGAGDLVEVRYLV